jgi:hypothetical protein
MAEHVLIDRYLAELRRTLARHRDVGDIVDEVADHLHTGAQRWRSRGIDDRTAERRTLDAFGDPALVARVYASERHGGFAMPTRFTRIAGTLLVVAGATWIVSFVLILSSSLAERTRPWDGLPVVLYQLGALALLGGALAMAVGLTGVWVRHRRGGPLALLALALLGAGVLATSIAWAIGLWVPLVGAGGALLAVWLLRHDMAPRAAAWQVGVGGALAGGGTLVLIKVGRIDGIDTPWLALLFVGLTAYAAGIVGIGRWLRSEQPLDDPEQALVA